MSHFEWLALHLTPDLGPAGCHNLVRHFGSPKKVLNAKKNDLNMLRGIKRTAINSLGEKDVLRAAERELERAQKEGITIISWDDENYPQLLRHIHSPPVVIYAKGNTEFLDRQSVGVVGARSASTYGRAVSEKLSRSLSMHGVTVVSGMALGVDTAAHQGALGGAGKTVAVLGCGIDVVYPSRNVKLYSKIAQEGLLLSEYPFRTQPEGFRFPQRNRIISGLSLGVVVVEAAQKSGSLITANFALEQGREVFAVPGRIDSKKSDGTHRLLQEGAKLVHTINDIFAELPILETIREESKNDTMVQEGTAVDGLNEEEKKILHFLEVYPKNVDEVIRGTGLSAQRVVEALLLLELKGLVESAEGKQYSVVENG